MPSAGSSRFVASTSVVCDDRSSKLALVKLAKSRGTQSGNGVSFTLPVNNNELAAQIGTVRKLVSRNLGRLQAEGLIQMVSRTIVVPDLKLLEAEISAAL